MPADLTCAKLKKPQMHGMLRSRTAKSLVGTFVSVLVAGVAFQVTFVSRRRKAYKDFHARYDIDKEFERMRSRNVFDSC
nr:unnamed protein product [Callosobruchus analis]CAI5848003.1 unnamed protein product [Callosobruchus analis]